jgi:hypothetical protein
VFKVPQENHTLGIQVDSLFSLIQASGEATPSANSIALVAVLGHDYGRVATNTTDFTDLTLLVERATDEIVVTTVSL